MSDRINSDCQPGLDQRGLAQIDWDQLGLLKK